MNFNQKRKSFFLVLILITYLAGCDEENEGPVALLNVVVDASYNTSEDDHWIIVHNAAGEILAVKPFESNETFALTSDSPVTENKIGVTLVQRHLSSGANVFSLNSYLAVEKGRT